MTVDAKTLKALKGSIAKWEGIVAGTVVDRGPNNCPLCMLFNNVNNDLYCEGCPVFEKTGRRYCDNTPYYDYIGSATASCAQAELDFLRSLLPPEEN